MALIPSKAKTNRVEDGGVSFPMITSTGAIILLSNKIFEGRIHSYLSWLLIFLLAIVIGYLVLPSSKNYGHNGHFRITKAIKHTIYCKRQKGKLKR